jgi:hypothetical protein
VRTVPFTRLQEAVHYVERSHTPWNIQLEVATTATLDLDRLGEAARAACEAYPMARVRCRERDGGGTAFEWVVPEAAPGVPITTVEATDRFRRRFYGTRVDLSEGPPLALLVCRGGGDGGGDRLCLRASHVPIDGIGAFRVLQALLAAYRDGDAAAVRLDATPRGVLDAGRPDRLADRLRLLGTAARRLGFFADSPVAVRGGASDTTGWPGWRFAHRHLDAETTERLVADRPPGVTVNDVLLAALHLAIDRWNADRGDPADRISLMMPMNARPPDAFHDGVGMYTLFDSVDTKPAHRRDEATALERVADRTDEIKAAGSQFGYLECWRLFASVAPPSARERVPPLVFGPGEPLLDTAVLSNLGRLPPLPGLADGDVGRPWLTPPSWPPTPLSVGVLTAGGRLHLGFRYERSVFGADDAGAFADRYRERLESMA